MSSVNVVLVDTSLDSSNFYLDDLLNFLSQAEVSISKKMKSQRLIDFVVGTSLARLMLSETLDENPKDILIQRNRYGRPIVIPSKGHNLCYFSISHSHGLIGCALAFEGQIGLDIEKTSFQLDLESIFAKALAIEEQEQISRITNYSKAKRRILELWCLKEAALKSSGVGLSKALNEISFYIDQNNEVATDLMGLKFKLLQENDDTVIAVATSLSDFDKLCVKRLTPKTLLNKLQQFECH